MVAALLVAGVLTSCQEVKVGAKCRGNTAASSGAWVVTCKKGHWTKLITKAAGLQYVAQLQARNNPPTPPPSTPTTSRPTPVTLPPAPATTTTLPPPIPPTPSVGLATQIGLGDHGCAIVGGGKVYCWGGATPYPDPTDSNFLHDTGIGDAIQISVASDESCVLHADHTVSCWGDNTYGQLGLGSNTLASSGTPVTVPGITTATQIATDQYHSCALLADHTVTCWGDAQFGQLGSHGTDFLDGPLAVPGISDATQIAVGTSLSCALHASGSVSCWGSNDSFSLGDGVADSPTGPVTVIGVSDAVSLGVGFRSACVVRAGGTVACWGENAGVEIVDGVTTATEPRSATDVPGVTGASTVTVSYHAACATLLDGTVWCWGDGTDGELTGTDFGVRAPSPVGLHNVVSTSFGDRAVCSLLTDGSVWCWGYNYTHEVSPVLDQLIVEPTKMPGLG